MTEAGAAALRALEALEKATPEAPAADTEPDEVATRAGEVMARREKPLRDLALAIECDPHALRGLAAAAQLHARIQERAAAWQAVLARARHLVGERAQAVSRLRKLSRP